MAIDLDAYFRRIGYEGSRSATLETLQAINLLHVQAIPFENLDPLIKWPVKLDEESLVQKLVHNGRGGYCYEHNLLFGHVLEALGFHKIWPHASSGDTPWMRCALKFTICFWLIWTENPLSLMLVLVSPH